MGISLPIRRCVNRGPGHSLRYITDPLLPRGIFYNSLCSFIFHPPPPPPPPLPHRRRRRRLLRRRHYQQLEA